MHVSHHVYHGIAWCTYAPGDAHTNKLLATIMNGINIAGLVFGSKRDQYFQFSNYTFLYTILLLTHFSCPKNVSVSQWQWNGNMIAGGWRERLRSSRLFTRSICVRTSRIGKAKAPPGSTALGVSVATMTIVANAIRFVFFNNLFVQWHTSDSTAVLLPDLLYSQSASYQRCLPYVFLHFVFHHELKALKIIGHILIPHGICVVFKI